MARAALVSKCALMRYRFDELAERHGFIAVCPEGYQQHWNDCRGGANYAANLENIDDVGLRSTGATHG